MATEANLTHKIRMVQHYQLNTEYNHFSLSEKKRFEIPLCGVIVFLHCKCHSRKAQMLLTTLTMPLLYSGVSSLLLPKYVKITIYKVLLYCNTNLTLCLFFVVPLSWEQGQYSTESTSMGRSVTGQGCDVWMTSFIRYPQSGHLKRS